MSHFLPVAQHATFNESLQVAGMKMQDHRESGTPSEITFLVTEGKIA
ncbi:MAG: hypothetical protein OXG25_00410 [Gammaproteobacteria bacterium]|nr:hypothetical protein [Gammaproteobacteria bacterium]